MISLPEDQPYAPAEHLISDSGFTSEQLVTQFEDFRKNLRHTSTALEFVFERLVANLNKAFNTALESERQNYTGTLDRPEKELAELKLPGVTTNTELIQSPGSEKTSKKSSRSFWKSETQETVSTPPATKQRPNPAIGVFHTLEVRSCTRVCHQTSETVSFSRPYSQLPCLPIGLTAVDIDHHKSPRVQSYANNINNDRFQINIDSWKDTNLYSAGCAWLEIEADDPDFQSGRYFNRSYPPHVHYTQKITFPRAYSSIPVVVVWLTTLDMDNSRNWRVRTFATDVTATGFTIHIDTWLDSILYTVGATWVSYPWGKPGVHSGRFSTLDLRSPKNPQLYNSGYEKFGNDIFDAPPRTLLAIDSLDIDHERSMRLSVKASAVSATGMTWHLDAWNDTILYSAGASYIALS